MKELEGLLSKGDTELGRLLRCQIAGLCASVERALAEYPKTQEHQEAAALLKRLQGMLAAAEVRPADTGSVPPPAARVAEARPAETPPDPVVAPAASPEAAASAAALPTAFEELRDALASDGTLGHLLGDACRIQGHGVGPFWVALQTLLLRLPDLLATRWRERAAEAAGNAGYTVGGEVVQLAYDLDQVVYPGLVGPVSVAGVELRASAKLDSRVEAIYSARKNSGEDLLLLGQIASILLHMLGVDPGLSHAWEPLDRFGIVAITREIAESLRESLLDRYKRISCAAGVGMRERFEFDELIHSIFHVPFAPADSWWGQLRQRCTDALFRAAKNHRGQGGAARIQVLPPAYKLARAHTENDIALPGHGSVGSTLHSLRAYAEIDNRTFNGRVIYSSAT